MNKSAVFLTVFGRSTKCTVNGSATGRNSNKIKRKFIFATANCQFENQISREKMDNCKRPGHAVS
jgi:hypothetical protein